MIAYRRGALDEAAGRLEKALSANPGHTQASLYLAEIYGKQGRAGESRSILEKAFERGPQDAGVFSNRGMIFMKEGDLERRRKISAGRLPLMRAGLSRGSTFPRSCSGRGSGTRPWKRYGRH